MVATTEVDLRHGAVGGGGGGALGGGGGGASNPPTGTPGAAAAMMAVAAAAAPPPSGVFPRSINTWSGWSRGDRPPDARTDHGSHSHPGASVGSYTCVAQGGNATRGREGGGGGGKQAGSRVAAAGAKLLGYLHCRPPAHALVGARGGRRWAAQRGLLVSQNDGGGRGSCRRGGGEGKGAQEAESV